MRKKRPGEGLFKVLSLFAVIICVMTASFFILSGENRAEPDNPMEGRNENASIVRLVADSEVLSSTQFTDNPKDDSKTEEESDQQGETENNSEDGSTGDEGMNLVASPNNNSGKVNEFFYTNIKKVYTTTDVMIGVYQKEHSYTVTDIDVTINGVSHPEYNVRPENNVVLLEGTNTVKVTVSYRGADGVEFKVPQTFTPVARPNEVVIYCTDLDKLGDDAVVLDEELTFTAYAMYGESELAVNAQLNDENIAADNGNQYKVKLRQGLNKIYLTAQSESGQVAEPKLYRITYKAAAAGIRIDTNLKNNQVVSVPEITFRAEAKGGTNPRVVSVICNDISYQPTEGSSYTITNLNRGVNYISISVENDDGDSYFDDYAVRYTPLVTDTDKPDEDDDDNKIDPNAPTIHVEGLVNGQHIKGSTKTIYVKAQDKDGNRIGYDGMTIYLNEVAVPYLWQDGEQISFMLKFKSGENTLKITVRDKEGRSTTKIIRVVNEMVDKGTAIGTATISFEASTIGIPYLIEPTKITIYDQEPLSYLTERILNEFGFKALCNSLDANFYLSGISKPGMISSYKIPDDLLEKFIKEVGESELKLDSDVSNSLEEFDITTTSGWMFSVNGWYPNVGAGEVYLSDGDVVRWRFTIATGADIGGSGATGASGSWGDW